jgi:thiamine-monophosphate kinase
MPNEADIIRTLQKSFACQSPEVFGIGDDAAVLPLNDTDAYVVSMDVLVENLHFRLNYGDAANLVHKSLHVNLSDIAAMGAAPLFVLLGIALPPHLTDAWIEQFLASFAGACKQQNVQLVGGDTVASERDLFISVTVIGRTPKAQLKFRRGAKPGDAVCVAGALGEARAGLAALEKNAAGLEAVKAKSLAPNALIAEGIWLSAQKSVTAMMDVSDGLYVDLGRLLQASQVGAELELELLQVSAQLKEACVQLNLDARECMLAGGEDYALLFTLDPGDYGRIAQEFEKKFGYPLVKIGAITAKDGLELREGGKPVPFTYRSFSHFGEL